MKSNSLKLRIFAYVLLAALQTSACVRAAKFYSHRNCNDVSKDTIMPIPGNCSQYIQCNGLRSILGECDDGSYFNMDMLSCDKNALLCMQKSDTLSELSASVTNNK